MKRSKTYREEGTDRKWDIIAARLSGEETPNDELYGEIEDDNGPLTREMWKEMEKMKTNPVEPDVDKAWDKVYGRLSSEDLIRANSPGLFSRSTLMFARIAASVLILLSAGYITYRIVSSGHQNMLTAGSGDSKNVIVNLPDGSRVTLNRNTTVTWPDKFDELSRTVELTGEAYFEVVSDLSKPFRVIAGDASVEVLGTSFNVIAGEDKKEVEVFVTSGKVRLTSKDESDAIELTEGLIGKTSDGKTVGEINTDPNYMAWNSGILVYESAKLETVLNDLKKVYGIEIVADDPVVTDKYITTVLDNVEEEDIIKIIAATFNLSWRKEGRVYIFSQL